MIKDLKPKEATAIVNSLMGGVIPKFGIQHITVGRAKEIDAMLKALEDVKEGHSIVKFWIGDYGSGKSFMLHLLNVVAMKQKFVTATTDFTPVKRLYANDRKAVSLYSSLIDNLAIQTKAEGGALETLLEKWIEQVMMETAKENNISFSEIRNETNSGLIKDNILKTIHDLTDIGGYDFGLVILKYYEGYLNDDQMLRRNAVRWLKGEYTTKTEAKHDLGVRTIINDSNFYDMLKNFAKLFTSIGYSGFLINFDEAVNLYKIPQSQMREKNYEKILSIYNDCYQGKTANIFINIAGTNEFLENERRGLFSYNALKTRIAGNKFETAEIRDFAQPVIKLLPLNHNEIFVLLNKLKEIFDFNYSTNINIDEANIHAFMEHLFNQPGANEFLTPREVIKDFLNILSILRQNPDMEKLKLFETIEVKDNKDFENEDSFEEF